MQEADSLAKAKESEARRQKLEAEVRARVEAENRARAEAERRAQEKLEAERRIPREALEGLAALGHTVGEWPEWEWRAGAVCGRPAAGSRRARARRREGLEVGWSLGQAA